MRAHPPKPSPPALGDIALASERGFVACAGRLLVAVAMFAAAAGVGCGEADDASEADGCTSDSACTSGLVCQANRCVDPAVETLPLAIELRLPNAPGDLAQQVTGLVFTPGEAMPAIQPLPLIPATVGVTRRTQAVAANVTFRAQRAIPGTAVNVTTNSSEATLLAGVYEVAVRPQRDDLAPRTYTSVEVERSSDGQPTRLDFPLVQTDLDEKLVDITGNVRVRFAGTTENLVPEFARVFARNPGGRGESTVWEMCREGICDGRFLLSLPAQAPSDTRRWELVVESTLDSVPIPRIVVGEFVTDVDALENGVVRDDETIEVDIGPWIVPEVPRQVAFEGVVRGDDGPVPGAVVSIKGASAQFEFGVGADAPTGEDGRFSLLVPDLVDGLVTATVSLDPTSEFASTRFEDLSIGVDTELVVERKPTFAGLVLGRDGAPVPDASVELRALGNSPASPVIASTGSDGRFETSLEPASWELTVRPPLSAELPTLRREVEVAPATDSNETYALGPSSVVFGNVVDADGLGVADVSVDIYAHDVEAGTAQLLGRGVTSTEGVYRVIVPSPDSLTDF